LSEKKNSQNQKERVDRLDYQNTEHLVKENGILSQAAKQLREMLLSFETARQETENQNEEYKNRLKAVLEGHHASMAEMQAIRENLSQRHLQTEQEVSNILTGDNSVTNKIDPKQKSDGDIQSLEEQLKEKVKHLHDEAQTPKNSGEHSNGQAITQLFDDILEVLQGTGEHQNTGEDKLARIIKLLEACTGCGANEILTMLKDQKQTEQMRTEQNPTGEQENNAGTFPEILLKVIKEVTNRGASLHQHQANVFQGNTGLQNASKTHQGHTGLQNASKAYQGNTGLQNASKAYQGNTGIQNASKAYQGVNANQKFLSGSTKMVASTKVAAKA